jgi:hypothetical protein
MATVRNGVQVVVEQVDAHVELRTSARVGDREVADLLVREEAMLAATTFAWERWIAWPPRVSTTVTPIRWVIEARAAGRIMRSSVTWSYQLGPEGVALQELGRAGPGSALRSPPLAVTIAPLT